MKGRFYPKNPQKYKGNSQYIVYRSSWEMKFMRYCDDSKNILEWGSEEIIVLYESSWDKKVHRYFPDFYVKVKQSDGTIKKLIIEIKTKKYLSPPPSNPKRKTKSWWYMLKEWHRNTSKWKQAKLFAKDRGMEFKIMTEDDISTI